MAVKWVAEAARELGMDVLEAIDLLASKQNYPMNGLLDEDRVLLLKRYRVEVSGSKSAVMPAPPIPPASAAAQPPPLPRPTAAPELKPGRGEVSSVTAPLPHQLDKPSIDKTEERTVIIPAPSSRP